MILVHLLIALVLSLLCSLALYLWLGWRSPVSGSGLFRSFLFLFSILFAFIWVGGAWLPPLGPTVRGAALLPYLLTSLFITLLLHVLAMPGRPRASEAPGGLAPSLFGAAYVVLVGGLLVFGLVAYIA